MSFFSKSNVFLHFKTVIFFDFILQFLKESDTSEYNGAYQTSFQTASVDINRLVYAPPFWQSAPGKSKANKWKRKLLSGKRDF